MGRTALLVFGLPAGQAFGQTLPQAVINQVPVAQSNSLNTGYTTFFDAFGSTEKGLMYQGFLVHRRADAIKDANGNNVAVPADPRIDIFALANQFVYTTAQTIAGASLGFTTVIPIVRTHATSAPFPPPFPPGTTLTDNGTGLSDVVLGIFLQFKPTIADGRPVFVQRMELDVIAPTGRYTDTRDVQPGSNFWVINPYWSLTWLPTPRLELSTRLQYAYNYRNTSPANTPPGVTDMQAGQAALANFTLSYVVAKGVHVGLNGYYIRQLTPNRVNGVRQDDTKIEKLALGPGMLWDYSKTDKLFFNYYSETHVRNAPRSKTVVLRWMHLF